NGTEIQSGGTLSPEQVLRLQQLFQGAMPRSVFIMQGQTQLNLGGMRHAKMSPEQFRKME
ncbi:hypothetical protein ABTP08_20185, partial [Acinetobacter baumannii]